MKNQANIIIPLAGVMAVSLVASTSRATPGRHQRRQQPIQRVDSQTRLRVEAATKIQSQYRGYRRRFRYREYREDLYHAGRAGRRPFYWSREYARVIKAAAQWSAPNPNHPGPGTKLSKDVRDLLTRHANQLWADANRNPGRAGVSFGPWYTLSKLSELVKQSDCVVKATAQRRTAPPTEELVELRMSQGLWNPGLGPANCRVYHKSFLTFHRGQERIGFSASYDSIRVTYDPKKPVGQRVEASTAAPNNIEVFSNLLPGY